MSARYLVRLDDACPTMAHARWDAVEALLDDLGASAIVAVVPDNLDPALMPSPPSSSFWNRVRAWEAKGWWIAMHGLHHRLQPVERRRLLVPFNDRSEFGGLDPGVQAARIARSWELFESYGIRPSVWIAPAHSFDRATIRALERETPIRIISDGVSVDHFWRDEFVWLPQQLWWPAPRRRGLWTICLHPNNMDEEAIARLREALSQPYYRERLRSPAELDLSKRAKSLRDYLYSYYFFARGRTVSALLPLYRAGRRRFAALL